MKTKDAGFIVLVRQTRTVDLVGRILVGGKSTVKISLHIHVLKSRVKWIMAVALEKALGDFGHE